MSEDDEDIELYESRILTKMMMEQNINLLLNNLTNISIEGKLKEHDNEVQYEEVKVQPKKKGVGDDHVGDKPTFKYQMQNVGGSH